MYILTPNCPHVHIDPNCPHAHFDPHLSSITRLPPPVLINVVVLAGNDVVSEAAVAAFGATLWCFDGDELAQLGKLALAALQIHHVRKGTYNACIDGDELAQPGKLALAALRIHHARKETNCACIDGNELAQHGLLALAAQQNQHK